MSSGSVSCDGNEGPAVHAIVSTHVVRNLALVLRSLAAQSRRPTTLSVAVDAEHADIAATCADHAAATGQPVLLTQRVAHRSMRLAQTRNNAVRALLQRGYRDGVLLFLDGDIVATPETIRTHAKIFIPGRITVARRVNLDEAQSARFLTDGEPPPETEIAAELQRLERTHRRVNRHIWLRRFRAISRHKPNIIGAHFAIGFDLFCAINGFDENYEGYGCEDDDLARRAYAHGARATNAVAITRVFHLYHHSRGRMRRRDNPGGMRFLALPWTPVCAAGLDAPLPQHLVNTRLVRGIRDQAVA